MNILSEKENGILTLRLSGRLDTVTAPELDKAVTEGAAGCSGIIFDLNDLSYTSSAGLRIFLKAQKLMRGNGTLKLTNVCESVMEIFEMTGFTDMMDIEAKA